MEQFNPMKMIGGCEDEASETVLKGEGGEEVALSRGGLLNVPSLSRVP